MMQKSLYFDSNTQSQKTKNHAVWGLIMRLEFEFINVTVYTNHMYGVIQHRRQHECVMRAS